MLVLDIDGYKWRPSLFMTWTKHADVEEQSWGMRYTLYSLQGYRFLYVFSLSFSSVLCRFPSFSGASVVFHFRFTIAWPLLGLRGRWRAGRIGWTSPLELRTHARRTIFGIQPWPRYINHYHLMNTDCSLTTTTTFSILTSNNATMLLVLSYWRWHELVVWGCWLRRRLS